MPQSKKWRSWSRTFRKPTLQTQRTGQGAQLAAYGRYSVPFFVNILEVGTENAIDGAENGLRMVARTEPDSVCDTVRTVIQNRTGLYQWQTHLSVLKILGQASCAKACGDAARFRDTMSSLNNYQDWVSLPPTQSEFDKVSKQASDTFTQLKRLKTGDCN